MNNSIAVQESQNPLSKQAIDLPPRRRLEILLKAEYYQVTIKRSSAKRQIEEMLDFYNLCSVVLARYFPDESANGNFVMLTFLSEISEPTRSLVNLELGKAFAILDEYEKWEEKVTAIQNLFFEYSKCYPNLYEKYNLEEIATQKISDIVWLTRERIKEDSDFLLEVMRRWELT